MSMFRVIGDPWRELNEMISQLPGDLGHAFFGRANQYPRVNIWENETGMVLEAEIAGVDPAKLDISAEGNTLTIRGEKTRGGMKPYEFQRQFALPFELSEADIKATVKDGLLTLAIPRKTATKRKIAIETL